MNVAFFHGLESPHKSEKNVILSEFFTTVWDPLMNYRERGLFDKILSEIQSKQIDLLIGSSMGGWFAYCISTHTGIPTLLFNPAVQGRSFDPEIKLGKKSAKHTIILGVDDDIIDPEKTKIWFEERNIECSFHKEKIGHRIPSNIFKKVLKTKIKNSRVTEEWSTEAPLGRDLSFIPEAVIQTLIPNFLTDRPPVGNLTVEDSNEFDEIINSQKNLTQNQIRFIRHCDEAPHEIFYEWLIKRGYPISMRECRNLWQSEENSEIINQLKRTFQRSRPFSKYREISMKLQSEPKDFSFPSGHACGVYFIAKRLSQKWPHLEDALMNLARDISRTRIMSGVHYPSDVEAGKLIGLSLAEKKV